MDFDYLKWIEEQTDPAYAIQRDNADQISLQNDSAKATVRIYHLQMEIAVLSIQRTADAKDVFFLHFELTNADQAKELFFEMVDNLKKQNTDHKLMVLLSCTSGLTTSYFAEKLNEAAKVLSMNYEFNAVSYDRLMEKGFDYDVILLAPQINFQKKRTEEIFHRQLVLNIPGQAFGSYDTGTVIRMVRDELEKRSQTIQEKAIARVARDIENNARLLVLSMVHDMRSAAYAVRIYDKGTIVYDQEIVTDKLNLDTIDGLLSTALRTRPSIDAIGVAIPGVFGMEDNEETLNYKYAMVAAHLREKFRLPSYAINNTDCAALGFYASQDKYDLVTYHSQPVNSVYGGQGMVAWGHVIRGRDDVAGEINMLQGIVQTGERQHRPFNYDAGAVRESVVRALAVNIALFNPEVIYLRSAMTPDKEDILKGVQQYIHKEYLPDLIIVKDVSEVTLLGIMLMTLHELQKEKTGQLKMQVPVQKKSEQLS